MNPQGLDNGLPRYTQEELRAIVGDPAEMRKRMRKFEEDSDFFFEMETELLAKHPDRWVGVYNKTVLAVEDSLEAVLDELRRLGVPTGQAVIEFLCSNPPKMILWIC
jgi:hypothetical protein